MIIFDNLTDNLSIDHINIRKQDENGEVFNIVRFRLISLSVYDIKKIRSDKGSIDISNTFKLLYLVKKCGNIHLALEFLNNYIDPKL